MRWPIDVCAVCLLTLFLGVAQAADGRNITVSSAAEKRVALVIGNAAYKSGPLINPVNDARAMAARLRTLGFDVTLRENLKTREIGGTYREFRSKITPGATALVFYAGHGLQVKGQNYLPAVDADISSEEDVPLQSVNLGSLLDNMEEAKAGVSLVFLDACRDNPFARRFRSSARGLAKVEAASGTLIHYATKPGSVASDGDGKNGTYTEALLAKISEPGVPVELMLKMVTNQVVTKTKGKQEPWVEGSLRGDFYFIFQGPTTVQIQLPTTDPESAAWQAAESAATASGYQAYLDAYPNGRYAVAAKIKSGVLEKPEVLPVKPAVVAPPAPVMPSILTSGPRSGEQFIPAIDYRVGPYAAGGSGFFGGAIDYMTLVNRKGGVNGVKLVWEECETAYNASRGVECYERLKRKYGGAAMVEPMSTGIAYSLYDRTAIDKIPMTTLGYGRSDSVDGRVFPWVYPLITSYWSQAAAMIKYVGDKEGGSERLRGKKIAYIYHDSAFGKEPIPMFEVQARQLGFELIKLPVPHPGNEQQSQWLQIRQAKPDFVILWGWGVMNSVALKTAQSTGFPSNKILGGWWSGAEEDVLPAGTAAIGFSSMTYNTPGNYPVLDELREKVYAAGKGNLEDKSRIGSVYHMRGIIAGILWVEAIRKAQEKFGNGKVMTGEQVRWGFENLNVDEATLKEIGANGMMPPVRTNCLDHEGSGATKVQQWDGTRWNSITPNWVIGNKALVRRMVDESSSKYAAERRIIPRDCAKEGYPSTKEEAQTETRPGTVFKDCADCPEMVVIPAGSFQMGGGSRTEQPAHRVNIARPFALAKTEVTYAQWRAVMARNIGNYVNCADSCPAETVSWIEALEFVQRLSQKTGKIYRLPSEAEWEYACRAGSIKEFCGSDNLDAVAWYDFNSGAKWQQVAGKQPNVWGLYDMTGNVSELTEDCWNDNYRDAPEDGSAWISGDCARRVLRGGSWRSGRDASRATNRGWLAAKTPSIDVGFRVARQLP